MTAYLEKTSQLLELKNLITNPDKKITDIVQHPYFKEQLKIVRPHPSINVDRFVKIFLIAMNTEHTWINMDKKSLAGAILRVMNSGLDIDPSASEVWIVPFDNRNKKIIEARIMWGYKGLVQLCYRSGFVSRLGADCVYKGDYYAFHGGTEQNITHRPCSREEDKGDMIKVYAWIKLKISQDNEYLVYQMTTEEIDRIAKFKYNEYKQYLSNPNQKNPQPWLAKYDSMAKKTVFKRLYPWVPKGFAWDNTVELDDLGDQNESQEHGFYLDAKLENESYVLASPEAVKSYIEEEIDV
jgi:recombination protein RecT